MRKGTIIFILTMLCLTFGSYAQDGNLIIGVESERGLKYEDNLPGAEFRIDFPGEQIEKTEWENIYFIDGQMVQVVASRMSRELIPDSVTLKAIVGILNRVKDRQVEFLENELIGEEIEVTETAFTNSEGTPFLMWHYDMPESTPDDLSAMIRSQYYLSFMANSRSVTVNFPVTPSISDREIERFIYRIVDGVEVYTDYQALPLSYEALAKLNQVKSID